MAVQILIGDCRDVLATLDAESVQCVVTSPPYFGLRDYGIDGQIGLESTPDAYVEEMVSVFREVRRVLRKDGTLWLNLGDSYAGGGGFSANAPTTAVSKSGKYGARGALKAGGIKPGNGIKSKDLIGIPWRVAFALQADGWWLRSDIIWHKPNPMPESVTDRPTSAHEHLFLLTKSEHYSYDAAAVREPFADERQGNPGKYKRTSSQSKGVNNDRQDGGILKNGGGWERGAELGGRNLRNVWTVAARPFREAHFATFPPELVEPCILAGCPVGGTVLDPFAGAGTTGLVADRLQRDAILIELNPGYINMAENRIIKDAPLFIHGQMTVKGAQEHER